MVAYHDKEWGFPVYDDRVLFEFIILEGCQAGLSWSTVLKKRENYRKAFDNFDAIKIARYTQKKIEKLLQNPGIIRNKLKVNAAVKNAQGFLAIQKEYGSFVKYIWSFTPRRAGRIGRVDHTDSAGDVKERLCFPRIPAGRRLRAISFRSLSALRACEGGR